MTEMVVELKGGEIVVDFPNRLYQIISVPQDWDEQILCLDLATGKRVLVFQYGIEKVSKYFSFEFGNPVMFFEGAKNEYVKAKLILFKSGVSFVRIERTMEHKQVEGSNLYSNVRPILLNQDILRGYGFQWNGYVWTDGLVNLYTDGNAYQVQIVSDPLRFLRLGEDNHLNIIRTAHELHNVYTENRLRKNWPL